MIDIKDRVSFANMSREGVSAEHGHPIRNERRRLYLTQTEPVCFNSRWIDQQRSGFYLDPITSCLLNPISTSQIQKSASVRKMRSRPPKPDQRPRLQSLTPLIGTVPLESNGHRLSSTPGCPSTDAARFPATSASPHCSTHGRCLANLTSKVRQGTESPLRAHD